MGAKSRIGEAFALRFDARDITVVAAGRRLDHPQGLQKGLSGLISNRHVCLFIEPGDPPPAERLFLTKQWQINVENIASLHAQVSRLLDRLLTLDTVVVVAGIGTSFDFKDRRHLRPSR